MCGARPAGVTAAVGRVQSLDQRNVEWGWTSSVSATDRLRGVSRRRIALSIALLAFVAILGVVIARSTVLARMLLPLVPLLVVGPLVVRMVGPALSENHRRKAQVAAAHPGWGILQVRSTSSLMEAMAATERYVVIQVNATLAYGPAGIELWARHRDGSIVRVVEHPWSQIVDVEVADDIRDYRGRRVQGLRTTLVDGDEEDVIVMTRGDMIVRSSRAAELQLTALANDIVGRRTAAAMPRA